jgi:hypothetical protein
VEGGVCVSHGAIKKHKRCSFKGCAKQVVKGGVCVTHGAKLKQCSHEGCTNIVVKGGVCITHGAIKKHKRCSYEGCSNQVVKGGVCITHGAKVKRCSFKGCTKHVQKGGVCITHGAKKKQCSFEGCTSSAKKDRVGYRHRSKGINSNNIPTLQPNPELPSIPPLPQSINYKDEEAINSWIWRSTPMKMRLAALNYTSGTSSLLPSVPAPVVSAPSVYVNETDNDDAWRYDQETDNDDAFSTQGR